MTELFAVRAAEIRPSEALLKLLAPKRREEYLRLRGEEAKSLCLAAGLLVSRYIGGGECKDSFGKPFVPGARPFSISHSGGVCVLAAADTAVGVDIERVSDRRWESIAKRFFHQQEQESIFSLNSEGEKKAEFYRLWTMKESYMKAEGKGFLIEPESFSALSVKKYRFYFPALPEGFALCVCTADGDPKKIHWMEQ